MSNPNDRINRLVDKLDLLLKKQDAFSKEIKDIQLEINQLKSNKELTDSAQRVKPDTTDTVREPQEVEFPVPQGQPEQQPPQDPVVPTINQSPKLRSNWERFIGENLISKIGIGIIILGVAIGAKYAIDHQLINPLTRIVLGYLVGIGLLGFALKLKPKYENFSAVLLSGSMAILYFITYLAYSLYALIPQSLAFVLMMVFTGFTVLAALRYDRQVIAHIGLVGAYAVPFLLGDGSGKISILFTYMAVINIGILIIAFKKYWKPLYHHSFVMTWLIFLVWYLLDYRSSEYFGLGWGFLSLFFIIFYLTFLAYKLLRNEKFGGGDLFLLLLNSLIFYALGFSMLDKHPNGNILLGLFTLGNAVIHFVVGTIIHRRKLADRNLFYLVAGLTLVFITLTIPVQLDGNWVTLLWIGEAALLFWIGRTKKVAVYEALSYPLILLVFFSLIEDWSTAYGFYTEGSKRLPLLNIHFLTSLLFVAALGFINLLHRSKKHPPSFQNDFTKFVSFALPVLLILATYYTFRLEIAAYWNQLYTNTALIIEADGDSYPRQYSNYDYLWYKSVWIINYTLLFVSLLTFSNSKRIKNQILGSINLVLIALTLTVFLTQGLYALSELRVNYLDQTLSQYYRRGAFSIGIRYVSLAFVTVVLLACHHYLKQSFVRWKFPVGFDFLLHITLLWIGSSELINWMDLVESTQSHKLGLSILWGMYALFLITQGIRKKKKHLRIGAIVLFGVTLVKLFFYDIAHLDTIAKTIVFVSLGVLLLIISFLYNKYRHIISDEATE